VALGLARLLPSIGVRARNLIFHLRSDLAYPMISQEDSEAAYPVVPLQLWHGIG
jgi:hypothetical protein